MCARRSHVGRKTLASCVVGLLRATRDDYEEHFFSGYGLDDVLPDAALASFCAEGVEFIYIVHRVEARSLGSPHGSLPTRDDDDDKLKNKRARDGDARDSSNVPGPRAATLDEHRQYAARFTAEYESKVRRCARRACRSHSRRARFASRRTVRCGVCVRGDDARARSACVALAPTTASIRHAGDRRGHREVLRAHWPHARRPPTASTRSASRALRADRHRQTDVWQRQRRRADAG